MFTCYNQQKMHHTFNPMQLRLDLIGFIDAFQ